MIQRKIVGVIFCSALCLCMANVSQAAWEDRTDPAWWPGTGYGASWDGTQWLPSGPGEIILKADPGDNGGTLQGSTFAGDRPTKVRVTHTGGPQYFSLTNVGGGTSYITDGSYVSLTELDITYVINEDIGRLYLNGGASVTKIEFYFDDGGGSGNATADQQNITATIGETMTLNCGASVDIDNGASIIPGSPASNSTTCTVTTNDAEGYNLSVVDDRTTSNALYHATLSGTADGQIIDKIAWDPTAGSGVGNAVAWSGTGLGFGVLSSTATKNTTWWGTGTTCADGNQLYAGLPSAETNVMEHASYSNASTDTIICYRIDVPSTQIAGEYTGSVTYTATGRP